MASRTAAPVRRTSVRPAKPGVERLEDRLVPAGRPLPYPVIAAAPGEGGGTVRLVDALTGNTVQAVAPFEDGFAGGISVAVGDLTGDGYPDVVAAAGAGGGPRVRVFDGKSGQFLAGPLGDFFAYEPGFRGGVAVAVADVTGDGVNDVVTAAAAGGGPRVRVFDGKTGAAVRDFFAFESTFTGGVQVAAADLTGDGQADLVLAAGGGGGPRVRVIDGATMLPVAGPLGDFFAADPAGRGGASVAAADVTGDGTPDVVTGSGAGADPAVTVWDGKTRAVAWTAPAFGADARGGVRVAAAWVTDDPYADVVVGTGPGAAPRVRTLDGQTGQVLAGPVGDFDPGVGAAAGGVNVAAGNDPPTFTLTANHPSDPESSTSPTYFIFHRTSSLSVSDPISYTVTGTATANQDWVPVTVPNSPPPTASRYLPLSATGSGSFTFAVGEEYVLLTFAWVDDLIAEPTEAVTVTSGTQSDTYQVLDNDTPTAAPALKPSPYDPTCGCANAGGASVGGGDGAPATGAKAQASGGADENGAVKVSLFGGLDGGPDSALDQGMGYGVGWTNATGYADPLINTTSGTAVNSMGGRVTQQAGGTQVALIDGAGSALWFAASGGTYTPLYGYPATLTDNTTTHEFALADGSGATLYYADFGAGALAGRFLRRTALGYDPTVPAVPGVPPANVTAVTSRDSAGRPAEVQMADAAGAVESLVSTYSATGELQTLTRRREVGGGAWATVRTAVLTYGPAGGNTVLVGTVEKDAAGAILEETYNRYYDGTAGGYAGGLKYHLGADATARIKADHSGVSLDSLSDPTVAAYADKAISYNPTNHWATQVVTAGAGCSVCSSGFGTSAVQYMINPSPGPGPNAWATAVVDTLDDGTVSTTFANAGGQTMLTATTPAGGTQTWLSYTRYDAAGRVVLEAAPSAVSGYDPALPDLVGYGGGSTATYLRDADGLDTTFTYATTTTATATATGDVAGYLSAMAIRHGETGGDVPQSAVQYVARTAGGVTTYHQASQTRYRSVGGAGAETTTWAYTWQGSTQLAAAVMTTLPMVTTAENGPNAATSMTTVYNAAGRPVWQKDAGGFLTYTAYDPATGAVVKTIRDVDTVGTSHAADFTGLPSGWSTPSGGGLHLITTYEVDALGRVTTLMSPGGRVDYTVYNDANHEVRTYPAWDTTTNRPTGPTEVTRDDRANGYSESLTMSATPAVSGGRPTGTEAVSGLQSLSRDYRNDAGQVTHSDSYFSVYGLVYSADSNLGTLNANYYRTTTDYAPQGGQPNRQVSAAGTITRTVYDGLGRPVATWVGTNDDPAHTDMVQVSATEYDDGGVGDGNVTRSTAYPGLGGAPRVTRTWYDWRDRAVATEAGAGAASGDLPYRPIVVTTYDNLNEPVFTQTYAGRAAADVFTDNPAASTAPLWLMRPDPTYGTIVANTPNVQMPDGKTAATQPSGYTPYVGDFDGDGQDDLLWRENGGSGVIVWTLRSGPGGLPTRAAVATLSYASGYTPYVGDFNADGVSDVLWYQAGGSSLPIWRMRADGANGTAVADAMYVQQVSGATTSPAAPVAGYAPYVGDFNGDGQDDLLWRQVGGTGPTYTTFWTLGLTGGTPVIAKTASNNFMSAGYNPVIGDFNGDGVSDLLPFNPASKVAPVWLMKADATSGTLIDNAPNIQQDGGDAQVTSGYAPYVGDFNGDGQDDLLWRQSSGTGTEFWTQWIVGRSAPDVVVENSKYSLGNGYTPVVGNFDGDGVTPVIANGLLTLGWEAAAHLRAQTITRYDELGRAYRTETYSVDPVTGVPATTPLASDTWYDVRGNVVKTAAPGGLVEKTAYDGAGRSTFTYATDGAGGTAYADAGTVANDHVLSQDETAYDPDGDIIQATHRDRFHDASTAIGALGTPTSPLPTAKARVSYAAYYYDAADRPVATADVGTNFGSAWTRPGGVPARSDTVLVTSTTYDTPGRVFETTDPKGLVTRTIYDALGRAVYTAENYVDGVVSDADDKITEYAYGPAGMTSLTADLTGGGKQTTAWVYGVTNGPPLADGTGGSAISSKDVARATQWPDPTTGAASAGQQDLVRVNALGQPVWTRDRNGTEHTLTYDRLGRLVSDAAAKLGASIDATIQRVGTEYDEQGNAFRVTTYNAASGGLILRQVQRAYNGLGQLAREWQSSTGAVDPATTPSVQYAYSGPASGANYSRLSSMTYPGGYVLTYNYGTGLNGSISRLDYLSDSSGTLETYGYLGLGEVVKRGHPQTGVDLTMLGTGPGSGGDQYVGLDRFGRVVDQNWQATSPPTSTDRFTYTYDRDSNRLTKVNAVNTAFNESYSYDNMNQLTGFTRGSHHQSWDYDAVGSMDSVTTDGVTQTRTANAQNEIASINGSPLLTYDANGNVTRDEAGRQFVYDAWNRLKVVKDAANNVLKTYGYDGFGRRVAEIVGSVTTDLYYSAGWQVLEERVSGSTTARYVWSPEYVDAIVMRDRSTTTPGTLNERVWVLQDANFNVTAITDGSGAVLERYAYDPYGVRTVLTPSFGTRSASSFDFTQGFQGLFVDNVSGLDYARGRWYSPTMQRWTTMDPIQYASGTSNLYQAFLGNPTNYNDPLGLDPPNRPGSDGEPRNQAYGKPRGWRPPQSPPPTPPTFQENAVILLWTTVRAWQDAGYNFAANLMKHFLTHKGPEKYTLTSDDLAEVKRESASLINKALIQAVRDKKISCDALKVGDSVNFGPEPVRWYSSFGFSPLGNLYTKGERITDENNALFLAYGGATLTISGKITAAKNLGNKKSVELGGIRPCGCAVTIDADVTISDDWTFEAGPGNIRNIVPAYEAANSLQFSYGFKPFAHKANFKDTYSILFSEW